MDYCQLLNTSTDFDQNKLTLLENVVETLYSPSTSSSDVSKFYNKQKIFLLILFI